jgi:hypothetical protein
MQYSYTFHHQGSRGLLLLLSGLRRELHSGIPRYFCWGSVQITKFYVLRNPELPKDLSISNAIIVVVSDTYPQKPKHGDYAPAKALTMKTT